MAEIHYVNGDATDPQAERPWIIAHVCNDIGAWGRGFVLALGKRYPFAEKAYRRWYQDEKPEIMQLGRVQHVLVNPPGGWVANMVAQRGIMPSPEGVQPIRYEALAQCLAKVCVKARELGATVHMPRIGCGLAGGKWEDIEKILTSVTEGVVIYVYDYEGFGPEVIPWTK